MSSIVKLTPGRVRLWTGLVFVFALSSSWAAPELRAQPCILPPFIPPTGITQDPGELLQPEEHHLMHSSTHLQGTPAYEKVTPVIHLPGTGSLANMRTGVIVNNTSSIQVLNVIIEYIDPMGVVVGMTSPSIAPDGHHIESATPLAGLPWGTVRVRTATADDPPFVGATIFHTYDVGVPTGGTPSSDIAPDPIEPKPYPGEYEYSQEPHLRRMGAASMQQLQVRQDDKNELFWGPLPVSNSASPIPGMASPLSWDFMNGNCPLIMVTNPSPNPITINVLVFDQFLNVLATYPRTLNGYASWVDMNFFEFFVSAHTNTMPYDLDMLCYVSSAYPIVGQGVMFDFFGQMTDSNRAFLERFRMGSTMMSNTRASTLISPELVAETSVIATNTLMGIANVTFGDIGPVTVEYRDRNGAVTANVIPNFPAFSTLRIGPGSPGYPANEFAGSVTIRSCQAGLIGWNMKTTEHPGRPESPEATEAGVEFELQKAWGEVLHGGNGVEPGALGWPDQQTGFFRKLGPLNVVFRGDPGMTTPLPSYNHVFNNAVSNVNPYFFRFFDGPGVEQTDFGPQPFAGVRIGSTSFTYIDNTVPLVLNPTPYSFVNSRFEHLSPGVTGIDAIGGYIYAWPWSEEDMVIPPPTGVYHGPCDVVGPPPWWCL